MFEVMTNLEGYREDFKTKGKLVELQTKQIVGMFSKNANDISWFDDKEKSNIEITDEQFEIARQVSEIFRSKRGQLIN